MKIRITQDGLHGWDARPIEVGAVFEVRGVVPAGWSGKYEIVSGDTAPEAVAVTNPARDPLDHDGDGKKGGSLPQDEPSDDLEDLRAEYLSVTGKKPHHLWKEARLRDEIEKAK